MTFLPIYTNEFSAPSGTPPDFVLVTGDAYIDHPSFGAAIISRVLVKAGFSVGIIAQPEYKNAESFARFGKPKYAFLVTSGNIDSMVNNYTVAKLRRDKDIYSPGGRQGARPDRAVIVYSNKIREKYKDAVIILGGIEASLRRLAHYDYWSNKVRRSILLDCQADLLVYGMGETQIIEIAEALAGGSGVTEITNVKGTAYKTKSAPVDADYIMLPNFSEVSNINNKKPYNESFAIQYANSDYITAKTLVEPYDKAYVVQNTPAAPLSVSRLDSVYSLPYMGTYHPSYEKDGGVPAIDEVRFSLVSSRGCFGSCGFCALAFHQGRHIQARSHKSLVREAEKLTWLPDFKGYIHDVGGPTANFRTPPCEKSVTKGICVNKRCLSPKPCKNLRASHADYLALLKKLREIPKVKKVFIRSGLRYDYIMYDKDGEFLNELCKHHVSGQLKVAPEHISQKTLDKMGKPYKDTYDSFVLKYAEINKKLGLRQFLVPYIMSSHPGSDLNAAIELAEYLHEHNVRPEQAQDFYPTPSTLSTAMYYTGIDPLTGESVYVPKSPHEKAMQRALIQYRLPQNEKLVKEALYKAGRGDLIGFDKHCLIKPRQIKTEKSKTKGGNENVLYKHKRKSGKNDGGRRLSKRNR